MNSVKTALPLSAHFTTSQGSLCKVKKKKKKINCADQTEAFFCSSRAAEPEHGPVGYHPEATALTECRFDHSERRVCGSEQNRTAEEVTVWSVWDM